MGVQKFEAHKVLAYEHEMAELEKRKAVYKIEDSMEMVGNDANDVAEICVRPDCFDCFDDMLLFSLFRETPVFHEKGYKYGKAEHIEVTILVSR